MKTNECKLTPIKTVSVERWIALLAIAIMLLWLAWIMEGAEFVRTLVTSRIPKVASSGAEAATQSNDAATYLQQMGQVGDLFGGINALFAALACVGVVWAGSLQRRALIETMHAFEFERNAIRTERAAIALQQFETIFFQLLALNRSAIESLRIEIPGVATEYATATPNSRMGVDALEYLSSIVRCKIETSPYYANRRMLLDDMLAIFEVDSPNGLESLLGPYFRSLYQAIKLVDEMAPTVLTDEAKVRYTNVARGQIPEAAVLLLALNGLAARGKPIQELIERYGLLKYMPHRFLRSKEILNVFYAPQAFLGKKERSALCQPAHTVF